MNWNFCCRSTYTKLSNKVMMVDAEKVPCLKLTRIRSLIEIIPDQYHTVTLTPAIGICKTYLNKSSLGRNGLSWTIRYASWPVWRLLSCLNQLGREGIKKRCWWWPTFSTVRLTRSWQPLMYQGNIVEDVARHWVYLDDSMSNLSSYIDSSTAKTSICAVVNAPVMEIRRQLECTYKHSYHRHSYFLFPQTLWPLPFSKRRLTLQTQGEETQGWFGLFSCLPW